MRILTGVIVGVVVLFVVVEVTTPAVALPYGLSADSGRLVIGSSFEHVCTWFRAADEIVATAGHCVGLDRYLELGRHFYYAPMLFTADARWIGRDVGFYRVSAHILGKRRILKFSDERVYPEFVFVDGYPHGVRRQFVCRALDTGLFLVLVCSGYIAKGMSGSPVFGPNYEVYGILTHALVLDRRVAYATKVVNYGLPDFSVVR